MALGLAETAFAQGPQWWTSRGVVTNMAVTNDYAPANAGQLKNLAWHAYQEMQATVPGGADAGVSNRVFSLTPGGDFSPVNIGQLTFVAQPFYSNLIAVGYTGAYPWAGAPATNDFAPANIGQLKNVFSFDLTDTDGDGLFDVVEVQQGTDPAAYDTDHDGWRDGLDPDPRSRAWVDWGNSNEWPGSTAQITNRYWPAWCKEAKTWDGSNDFAASSFNVASNAPLYQGIAYIVVDTNLVHGTNMALWTQVSTSHVGQLYFQLRDMAWNNLINTFLGTPYNPQYPVVINTAALAPGNGEILLKVPMSNFPSAANIICQRYTNAIAIYDSMLFMDSDGDGLDDTQMAAITANPTNDYDADGLADFWEYTHGFDFTRADQDGNGIMDGLDDTDGDGLPDGWEVQNGIDPLDDGTTDVDNGAEGDPDGDGFDNALEFELGAPANNPAWNGNELAYRLTHAHEVTVTNTRSITTNLIGMRVDIEESLDCGGTNDVPQNKTDTLEVPAMLECGYYIDITVEGLVEDVDTNYDMVYFAAVTNTFYFMGHNGIPDDGTPETCQMVGECATRNNLILEHSTVRLRYDTVGHKWHDNGTYAEIIDATNTGVLKVELKATHPQNPGPTGSAAKYNNTPNTGSADNLFSTWDNEQFRIDVKIEPASFVSSLPAGFITWSAAGFSIPDNTTNYTFTWSVAGTTKDVTINFPQCGMSKKVYVDVPDVGFVNQQVAAAMLLPKSVLMLSYADEALEYAATNYPIGPQRDAIQHAYWNALNASHIGITQAETLFLTTAHEYNNKHGIDKWGNPVTPQQAFNSTMDLHNNQVGSTVNHTTLLGVPDRPVIQTELNGKYTSGDLWIWDGGGAQEDSEGILIKSNGTKIYPVP